MQTEDKEAWLAESENAGNFLSLLTWVIFGALYVGPAFSAVTVPIVVYACLSLTLVRMLPVCLCLTGSGLTFSEKLFAGWFGPRGMASIVFAVIVFGEELPAGEMISAVVICTVTLSILLHGLSARPFVALLAKKES